MDRVVVGVGGLQAHPQVIRRICGRVERDVDVVLWRRERGSIFAEVVVVFTIAILSAALVSATLAQFPTMFAAGTSAACRTIVSADVLVFDTVTLTVADVVELPAASRGDCGQCVRPVRS